MSPSRTATLLGWCAENRVQIDRRLEITDDEGARHWTSSDEPSCERGFSVCSRDVVERACTVVLIPKAAVLSVKSCFFSWHIPSVPYGHGAHLSLALALYGELLRGTHSRWFGYLQSLPRETVDIAMFWGANDAITTQKCTCSPRGCVNDDATSPHADEHRRRLSPSQCSWCVRSHDSRIASEWLRATEVDREQLGLMEEVRQYYLDVVEPTFRAASTKLWPECDMLSHNRPDEPVDSTPDTVPRVCEVSFPGYCHAYSLVSTRAFWVDAYHGLAMVPVADIFNHTNDNHVQMESDYDVCVECGSLAECEHDCETMASTTVPPLLSNVHPLSHDDVLASGMVDCLEMRTVRPVPRCDEVFNTYGALPNATLLSRYGFTLPENEHDTVRMVLDPMSTARYLFEYVGLGGDNSVEEEGNDAVTGASAFSRVAIRNALRGVVDNETGSLSTVSVDADRVPARGTFSCPSEDAGAWEHLIRRLLCVFAYVAGAWSSDAAWDEEDDGLVFNPQSPLARPVSFAAAGVSVRVSHDLVINADGKLSHNLWLFCILIALFAARPHSGSRFRDLTERVEGGPESIASLTELKATLINVQGYAERLRHLHDGDSTDSDVEGGGNHGSAFCPPLPHLAAPSLELDYDTESEEFAQPVTTTPAQPWPAIKRVGTLTSVTAGPGSSGPRWDPSGPNIIPEQSQPLGTGPQDPKISTSFSSIPLASSGLRKVPSIPRHPILQEESHLEKPSSSMGGTAYSSPRDRSPSAEGERRSKRARRCSASVAADRKSWRVDRLGNRTPDSARPGEGQRLQASDALDDDETTYCLAYLLARVVVGLCHGRYRPPTVSEGGRGAGMTAAELGELLDGIPESMPRTRRSLVLATGERSVVESCAASWGGILGGNGGGGRHG